MYVIGSSQETVHAGIVIRREEIGDVTIDETSGFRDFFHIYPVCQISQHAGLVMLLQMGDKPFDGKDDAVGISINRIAILEDGDNPVGSGDVLVNLQGLVVLVVEWQEIRDVLLVGLACEEERQDQRDEDEAQNALRPVLPHVVEESDDKSYHRSICYLQGWNKC